MMQLHWFANHANNENGRMAPPVITRPLMTVAQPSRTTLADLIPLIEQANSVAHSEARPNLCSKDDRAAAGRDAS